MTTHSLPPKPVMSLRVGVTGHRKTQLETAGIDRITRQTRSALQLIADGVGDAYRRYGRDYADAPPLLFFVSALADGADTLAANCALETNWRLLAPLPFSTEEYARDFSTADRIEFETLLEHAHSVAELDGHRHDESLEDRAYLQAGVVTVDQSDFLIAIWDGEKARGIGGTAMIKDAALSAGKPVIWINAVTDCAPVLLLGDAKPEPLTAESVFAALQAIVAPPEMEEIEHEFSGKQTHALAAYREFAEERPHAINYGSFFQFWEKIFAGKWPFSVRLTCQRPDAAIAAARQSTLADKLKSSNHDQHIFNELIIPRFTWADHLAVHYGNLYRSSYFFNYMFAAVAVFLALFDLVAGDYNIGTKTVWISIEVTLIFLILVVTIAGKRGRWHEKWIDYRQLAEEMRQYRLFFITLGGAASSQELPQGEGGEAAGWVDWYFAATRREAGMTCRAFNTSSIRTIGETILKEEIRPQIAYHNHKAQMLHAMEHRLHHLGEYAFGATLIVCLLYLTLAFAAGDETLLQKWAKTTKYEIKGLVTMMTGFLPALGASFFGIRVQGEFGSTAERSHATAAQLKTIVEKFEALTGADTPRLEILRLRVEEASRAMLMENMDWRLLYISKPLNLPG